MDFSGDVGGEMNIITSLIQSSLKLKDQEPQPQDGDDLSDVSNCLFVSCLFNENNLTGGVYRVHSRQ